jgi:hypothetical protein
LHLRKCPEFVGKTFQFKKSTSGYLAHKFLLYCEWDYDFKSDYFFSTIKICMPNGNSFSNAKIGDVTTFKSTSIQK